MMNPSNETGIYDHDSDLDVTHKINTIELDNWINHLHYIKKELHNLVALCGADLGKKSSAHGLLERLEKKERENQTVLEALQHYLNSRTGIMECEDTACDMIFITEHESYRRSYLYHLDKYRRLKDEFFSSAKGRIPITGMTSK